MSRSCFATRSSSLPSNSSNSGQTVTTSAAVAAAVVVEALSSPFPFSPTTCPTASNRVRSFAWARDAFVPPPESADSSCEVTAGLSARILNRCREMFLLPNVAARMATVKGVDEDNLRDEAVAATAMVVAVSAVEAEAEAATVPALAVWMSRRCACSPGRPDSSADSSMWRDRALLQLGRACAYAFLS